MRSGFFASQPTKKELEIPQNIHFIWFGGMLCQQHQDNILAAIALNPNYTVFLHTDSQSMTEEDFQRLLTFCTSHSIKLINLHDQTEETCPNLRYIRLELQYKKWGRSSDITRANVLYQHGGIYLDTDLRPKKSFGILRAPLGTLQYIEAKDPKQRLNIFFMAALANHPIYAACIEMLKYNYQLASSLPDHELWMQHTKDGELTVSVTSFLSGNVFESVIDKIIPKTHRNRITCNVKQFVEVHCDGSWMEYGGQDMPARHAFIPYLKIQLNYLNSEFQTLIKATHANTKAFLKQATTGYVADFTVKNDK